MRSRQPRSWIIIVTLVCALVYGALQYSPQEFLQTAPAKAPQSYPEAYAQGISDRTYSEQGALKQQMRATKITYLSQRHQSYRYIENPKVTIYSTGDNTPWHLSAKRGVAVGDAHKVTLKDHVRAWNNTPKQGLVTITTDNLLVDADRQYAHTDKPVTMRSAKSTTTGVGLSAKLALGRVSLLSEVKGTYEPQ